MSDISAVDVIADAIHDEGTDLALAGYPIEYRNPLHKVSLHVAEALADAGLLRQSPDELLALLGPDERSQAQRAFDLDHARDVVIEAAKAWRGGCAAIEYTYPTEDDLAAAVDALLEIEGGSQ